MKNATVLCKNHRERVTQIWTSLCEEEEEEEEEEVEEEEEEEEEDDDDEEGEEEEERKKKQFGCLVTFWFDTFAMLFSATGCVVRHENTRRWMVGCYKLAVFGILRDFFVLAYITRPCYPYI